ncbi:uncharacterized protein LOC134762226 [Penaeus indicus]|uniref:uncharacterized protein LOC134762226 n=1 Tax=Penaeus indicus TaxID=29960 RepID=UPI00300C9D82
MKDPICIETFHKKFTEQMDLNPITEDDSATVSWDTLQEARFEAAKSTFGIKKRADTDWLDANMDVLLPLLERKNAAHHQFKTRATRASLDLLKVARSALQKQMRYCANNYWKNLCLEIQNASDLGNFRKLYQGLKKAIGPSMRKVCPLKSSDGTMITDSNQQLASTPSGKAPGQDAIPADLLKCDEDLLPYLYEILRKSWSEGAFPRDLRDAKITTLYKNKGDKGDCNNYRGISLLSVTGKVFARVLLARFQALANRVYPESQCGFRSNRSTVDMIFSLRQIQEKCREQHRPLHMAFVDLTKAFDMVSREGLYAVLKKIGCPPTLLSLICSLHDGMQAAVMFEGSLSEKFARNGVFLRTRSDKSLYNLAHLRAKTKTRRFLVRELLFSDDAAFVSHSEAGLQTLMDRFAKACDDFTLTISKKKTVVMHQARVPVSTILVDGEQLENVDTFCYLGSVITNDSSLEKELSSRIGKAATAFSRLTTRAWRNRSLTEKTKGAIYKACVLSVLLYGSETWPTYARQERKLHAFHMRCLRSILGITWQDKVTNAAVLARTGCEPLIQVLRARRLRWLGHVRRLPDGRLPKDILYGELDSGARTLGRPLLRFKDVTKRDLINLNIIPLNWEDLAEDRPAWRAIIRRL